MPYKTLATGGGVVAAGVGLMFLGTLTGGAQMWADTDVPCLPGGHANVAQHIHAHLTISVDGEQESVPANVGVSNACMAEVHTHDRTGELHVETTDANTTRTLADFFAVWDRPLQRSGYTMEISVNGQPQPASQSVSIEDGQRIDVSYTSATTTATSTPTS